jgi:hypothetical protein
VNGVSNEDRVLVMRDPDVRNLLTTDPVVEMGDVISSTLAVFTVRRYAAIVADRQPASLGVLSGTGLTAPA